MKKYFFVLLIGLSSLLSHGQDVVIASKVRLVIHNVGLSLLGNWNYPQLDTTHWRSPKSVDQSVLAQDTKLLSPAQRVLKERLLGFFYNPKVISYDNGAVSLNTQKRLYRKNNIPLRYRKLAKQYYDVLNDSINHRKSRGEFDDEDFARNFRFFQDQYARPIE